MERETALCYDEMAMQHEVNTVQHQMTSIMLMAMLQDKSTNNNSAMSGMIYDLQCLGGILEASMGNVLTPHRGRGRKWWYMG